MTGFSAVFSTGLLKPLLKTSWFDQFDGYFVTCIAEVCISSPITEYHLDILVKVGNIIDTVQEF